MSLELQTLQLLASRERYERLAKGLPTRALETRTRVLLDDYGRFFKEFPDAPRIDLGAFELFFQSIHKTLPVEDVTFFKALVGKAFATPLEDGIEQGLLKRLAQNAAAYDAALAIADFEAGKEVDITAVMKVIAEDYEKHIVRSTKNPQVLTPIEDLLLAEQNDEGLHWRWPELNRHMKPIVGGDFIILTARPDKGKTSAIADNVTCMAAQIDQLWPGQNRDIMWLNNEGPGHRIVTRCFQAAIGCTMEELVRLSHLPATGKYEKYKTMVRQKYVEALGGRPGVLRVFDIHGYTNLQVRELIDKYNPALIIADMIDNIQFDGLAPNGGSRTDQLLEAQYGWFRNLAVLKDCGVIATSQLSADADGVQYPTLPQLKDSKTGKQGAADAIITLGAVNDEMLANSRYLGCTKNKKGRTGVPISPRAELIFNRDTSRYTGAPT